jgi:hypothetical protein
VAVDAAKVRRLRSDGLSWRAIAAEIGVPKDTLRRSQAVAILSDQQEAQAAKRADAQMF